ncbi:hypothetical protein AJ78_05974 [Emergomyces pasteurianus Ep9510]|uniref:Uncharacterized protein n=1 Tax=Emergomyces pasteurianus Ep9510 TaxID=1447872 RepID=A0A1J9QEH4_9EURO|nr:hypothetical protein AJ78_05974 [Emergomyces pasteurianus Ep9510]
MSSSTTQLKFLKNSAHHLAAQSPSTSSHLLAAHNQLIRDESKRLSVAQHRELCASCGTIRTSDSSKIVIPMKRNRMKKRRSRGPVASNEETSSPVRPHPLVIHRCLRCHRQKFLSLQSASKPAQSRKPHPPAIASAAQTPFQSGGPNTHKQSVEDTTISTLRKSTENLSSKKRAKSRKQQGLMAALAAGKQRMQSQASTSSSLNLLDFLKR